jgi:rare lipoprotein A
MQKTITLLLLFVNIYFYGQTTVSKEKEPVKDSLKTIEEKATIATTDTIAFLAIKTEHYKKNVLASYYANKFNGRKTASGKRFDNNKYTAAHKKLPFGTKVKVTNPVNGKFVVVEITDRGPFVRSREIDLSRRAFMEIANNKSSGVVRVNLEIVKK